MSVRKLTVQSKNADNISFYEFVDDSEHIYCISVKENVYNMPKADIPFIVNFLNMIKEK